MAEVKQASLEKPAETQDEFAANAQLIDDGVYLGSEDAALVPLTLLQSHKIGAVLIVGFGLRPKYAAELKYHQLKAVDLPVFNILYYSRSQNYTISRPVPKKNKHASKNCALSMQKVNGMLQLGIEPRFSGWRPDILPLDD